MTITIDVNDVREALDLTPMKEVISPDHRKAYNLAKDRLDEVFTVWALSDEDAAWTVLDSADFMEFAGRLNTIDDLDTAHNCSSIAALARLVDDTSAEIIGNAIEKLYGADTKLSELSR